MASLPEHRSLWSNTRYIQLVRAVGGRIARVAGSATPDAAAGSTGRGGASLPSPAPPPPHMQGLQWDYVVVKNSTPNAFVVPGGKVRQDAGGNE